MKTIAILALSLISLYSFATTNESNLVCKVRSIIIQPESAIITANLGCKKTKNYKNPLTRYNQLLQIAIDKTDSSSIYILNTLNSAKSVNQEVQIMVNNSALVDRSGINAKSVNANAINSIIR